MRVLGPIVQTLVRPMLDAGHDLTRGRLVGTQLIGDQPLWRHALLEQTGQQTPGRLGVSACLDDLVEDVAVLVDRAPTQPASLPVDANGDLVKMPDIARGGQLSMDAPCIVGAVFSAPAADRLVGDGDPAFEHHFFDFAQAHVEPHVKPDSKGDNPKAVVPVGPAVLLMRTGYPQDR